MAVWSKLPQEIRDQIQSEVLRGSKYVIVNAEKAFSGVRAPFNYRLPDNRPPEYIGLLLASREISNQMQEVLYKSCVFRAYLCRHVCSAVSFPSPQDFSRVQKVEIVLDISKHMEEWLPWYPDSRHIRGLERLQLLYHYWFEAFGGSDVHRDFCRARIINIPPSRFHHTVVYSQFLHTFKTFTGYRTVIVELGALSDAAERSHDRFSQEEYLQESNGPPEKPAFAGRVVEALKKTIETELAPSLGHCVYYDRGLLSCMEFRPRTNVPIQPGSAPYVADEDADEDD